MAREKILGIFVVDEKKNIKKYYREFSIYKIPFNQKNKKSKNNSHSYEPITIEEEEEKMDISNPMDFKDRKNFDNFHSNVKLGK